MPWYAVLDIADRKLTVDVRETKDSSGRVSLEEMQSAVKGFIEHVPMPGGFEFDMFCNEEARRIGMKPVLALVDVSDCKLVDVILGPVVVAMVNKEGDTVGLSQFQLDILKRSLLRVPMKNQGEDEWCDVFAVAARW